MHVTRGEAAVVLAMSRGGGPRSRGCADGWVGLLRNCNDIMSIIGALGEWGGLGESRADDLAPCAGHLERPLDHHGND